MTKEQFERAKEIEEELSHLKVAVGELDMASVWKPGGISVDLASIDTKYRVEVRQVFIAKEANLEAEFANL